MEHKVSILIQFRNRAHYLELCLYRLLANTRYDWNLIHLILIDDASDNWVSERVKELVEQHRDKNIHYVKYHTRQGTDRSFKEFIVNEFNSDYLVKLDSDVMLPRNWLTGLLRWFNSHPEIKIGNMRLTYVAKEPVIGNPWKNFCDNLNGAMIFHKSIIPDIDLTIHDQKWEHYSDTGWQKHLHYKKGYRLAIIPVDCEHIDRRPIFGIFGDHKVRGPHPLWLGEDKNKETGVEVITPNSFEHQEAYADFNPEVHNGIKAN